jgi:hypothetical protein
MSFTANDVQTLQAIAIALPIIAVMGVLVYVLGWAKVKGGPPATPRATPPVKDFDKSGRYATGAWAMPDRSHADPEEDIRARLKTIKARIAAEEENRRMEWTVREKQESVLNEAQVRKADASLIGLQDLIAANLASAKEMRQKCPSHVKLEYFQKDFDVLVSAITESQEILSSISLTLRTKPREETKRLFARFRVLCDNQAAALSHIRKKYGI